MSTPRRVAAEQIQTFHDEQFTSSQSNVTTTRLKLQRWNGYIAF